MKLGILSLLVLAQALQSSAYPWMAGPGAERAYEAAYEASVHKRAVNKVEERSLLGGVLGGVVTSVGSAGSNVISGVTGALGDLVNGLVTAGATNVDASNRFPDAAHPFQAPGSTDQRGVCPGLNALANHGYLPRNGIVTIPQVIAATKQVFNMGEDLSGLLAFFAVLNSGNIATQTFSIGGEDSRTYSASGIGSKSYSRQWGLDAHSRCEGDSSPTREDFYTNNGDAHSLSPSRARRMIKLAQANGGQFDIPTLNKLFDQNSQLSIENNPKYYANGFTLVVILAAYPIIPEFFSNGTYGAGGVSGLSSIAPLMGFDIQNDGTICAVPERIPDNWYRRATPWGVANVVANAPGTLLAGNTLPSPLSTIIASGNTNEIGCQLYQLAASQSPATLGLPLVDGLSSLVSGLQNQYLGSLPGLFGCSVPGSGSTQPAFDDSLQPSGPGGQQVLTCA
ncbi:hypothetical protein JCM10908_001785 [Rhodotorula pacifica]|uniref:peroxidase family protein n=1 Tax=Rhodotorula pacifica TaxID=1495444 RepID=UPI0031709CC7